MNRQRTDKQRRSLDEWRAKEALCACVKPLETRMNAGLSKAMDETPIKAGHVAPGKMGAAYFWPVYGERDEICFAFCPDCTHANVEHILGATPTPEGVLLSDGYGVYAEYTKKRAALEVFLADPEVPLDTNHVERAIRPVAIGRRSLPRTSATTCRHAGSRRASHREVASDKPLWPGMGNPMPSAAPEDDATTNA